jgi:hypothetical protein
MVGPKARSVADEQATDSAAGVEPEPSVYCQRRNLPIAAGLSARRHSSLSLESTMDKKLVGLLGAAASIATLGSAYATQSELTPSRLPDASSYAELLAPVTNAPELLKADDAARSQEATLPPGATLAQYHHHHHHHRVIIRRHHHHHHSIVIRRRGHHHHHHHQYNR